MKFVKGISLFFLYPCMMLCAGIYLGVEVERYFYPGRQEVLQERKVEESLPQIEQVAVEEEEILTTDTEYVLEEYDTKRGTVIETVTKVPEKYLGMDREDFVQSMDLYARTPPLSELERGFIGLEVMSFSRSRVVIRMNYLYIEPSKGFYLKVENNNIVVYCDDEKTIYMYTTISALELPDHLKSRIVEGIFMEDEAELYSFLETYSS
ncbi:MAG: hypothetical protein J1E83_03690 [Lachnospiraceae bacterium]|nr:hypothetical protein [Lachnospiraceae bacterium]